MKKLDSLWLALPLALVLAGTPGCEGINGGKQGRQNAAAGTLVASPPSVSFGNVPRDLVSSPTTLSFGNVQLGTGWSQTETLKNTGNENLTISAAVVSGIGFSITGLRLPLTLAPNQSSTFGVHFAPKIPGSSNGSLSVSISGSSTSIDMALSGSGVRPAALLASQPSLTFGNLAVGTTQTQAETVQNTGGSSATISYITVAGTGFSISGLTAPLTVAPGESISFSVAFAPKSPGKFTGSVSLASDPSNPLLTAFLSGAATGTLGRLSVRPTAVDIGNVVVGSSGTRTGILSAADGSVTVFNASSGSSEFAISGLNFPVTIAAGQSLSFSVTFKPQTTGIASVGALFASNASNSPTAAILTGNAVAATLHTVDLTWTPSTSPDIASYNIYRSVYQRSCGSYARIGSSSSTAYSDTVTGGTTYCYGATAVTSSSQESAYSTAVQVAIPFP